MERSLELFHDYGFWKTTLFLVIFILAGIIELIINVLFIHFIRKHAEGNRPVNLFIVIDQVFFNGLFKEIHFISKELGSH